MRRAFAAVILAALTACGHGLGPGLTPPPVAANSTPIIVDGGPASVAVGTVNAPFVTVTICLPGTATCQTIDHVLLDTGSIGLRIVASVLPASFNLPQSNAATGGTPLWECLPFLSAYSWGSVASADVKIANGTATSQSVQLIGVPAGTTVPADCVGTPARIPLNTVATLGANGILGVNAFQYDCPACTDPANIFPAGYYSCPVGGSCANSAVSLGAQVQNPIFNFQTENNGVAIVFPTVAAVGQLTARGSLILGIDTQSNNQLGAAAVVKLDSLGYFTTIYNSVALPNSFIDSGSNYLYFNDSSLTLCTTLTTRYCPASPQTLHATNQLSAGVLSDVTFNIDNAETLNNNNPTFNALPNIAGTNSTPASFDWGLPFFYGRTVFVGFENRSASQSAGPFFAY
jgi:hypothetical protein